MLLICIAIANSRKISQLYKRQAIVDAGTLAGDNVRGIFPLLAVIPGYGTGCLLRIGTTLTCTPQG